MNRFRRAAARRLFDANLRSVKVQAISSPLMDLIALDGDCTIAVSGANKYSTSTDDGGIIYHLP